MALRAGGNTRGNRWAILAEGALGVETSKTAACAVRYAPGRVASIIDSRFDGSTAESTLGFGGDIPVAGSLVAALEQAVGGVPDSLLIGVAPQGGALPDSWRPVLVQALQAGLDIVSGLHSFLGDDEELADLARREGRRLIDLRRPPDDLVVGAGRVREAGAFRVLTVGTDCNSGKMTTAIELRRDLEKAGVRTAFAATGQTGILLTGSGIAVDAVASDFIAGAAEAVTLAAARTLEVAPAGSNGPGVVLVEGQGSLLHPGYSGVTLGLMHGSMPHAMIMTWIPSRRTIYGGNHGWVRIPRLDRVVQLYEDALSWICPDVEGRVIGVSVSTWDLSPAEARAAVDRAADETGLPATDPVRYGTEPLVAAVVRAVDSHVAAGGSRGGRGFAA